MSESVIHIERTYNNTIEEVWHALTDYEAVKQWFFDIPDFKIEVGAELSFYENGHSHNYLHNCRILEVIPFEKLQYTWSHPTKSSTESIVTWLLIPRGRATILRLTHDGVDNFKEVGKDFSKESYENGWSEILGTSLHNYLLK